MRRRRGQSKPPQPKLVDNSRSPIKGAAPSNTSIRSAKWRAANGRRAGTLDFSGSILNATADIRYMKYRCVATSVAGFVQQLVSCYLPHGYWFYVSGLVPPGKDPAAVDEKLLAKYGIGLSRTSRARRKAVGIANVHYLRYQRRFLLLATHGFHPFYDAEAKGVRDARETPIKFEGYSISVARGGYKRKEAGMATAPDDKWRVRVQIQQELFKGLKAYLTDIAQYRSTSDLAAELHNLPFEPYAPIRQQLLNLVRYVNKRRKVANLPLVSPVVLRYRRRIVRPFEPIDPPEEPLGTIAKVGGR